MHGACRVTADPMPPPAPLPRPSLFRRAREHAARHALDAPEGRFTYADLLAASESVARLLLSGRPDLVGARIAFLVPPGFRWTAVQWGIWRAGGVAVPLALAQPGRELAHVLADSAAERVVADPGHLGLVEPVAAELRVPVLGTVALFPPAGAAGPRGPLPAVEAARGAMILYTSGTTGRPKGVVITHGALEAQVRSLVHAWGWNEDDHVLLVLPLHHVHGIVNVLTCALWTGARCSVLPRFDAATVWERLARGDLTLFMAVPTIYARLLSAWEGADAASRRRWSEGARRLRLAVSGSAALPVSVLERWQDVTGQRLLERYGMTEIGMALSNPLVGERRAGYVGTPLPGVEVRLVDEDGGPLPAGKSGELHVRGATVFREYWRRPEETRASFTPDGWFRTGDVAVLDAGSYRILGRASVDIVKTGGEKVSALEVEDVLREHPAVVDCAVVGVADPDWGERLCAAIVPDRETPALTLEALREWAGARLSPWKIPRGLELVADLPRNAMGKVDKPALRSRFSRSRR